MPSRIQLDIVGTRPARSECDMTSCDRPSSWMMTRPGSSVRITSGPAARRASARAPRNRSRPRPARTAVLMAPAMNAEHERDDQRAEEPAVHVDRRARTGRAARSTTAWKRSVRIDEQRRPSGSPRGPGARPHEQVEGRADEEHRDGAAAQLRRCGSWGSSQAVMLKAMTPATSATTARRRSARRPRRQCHSSSIWVRYRSTTNRSVSSHPPHGAMHLGTTASRSHSDDRHPTRPAKAARARTVSVPRLPESLDLRPHVVGVRPDRLPMIRAGVERQPQPTRKVATRSWNPAAPVARYRVCRACPRGAARMWRAFMRKESNEMRTTRLVVAAAVMLTAARP